MFENKTNNRLYSKHIENKEYFICTNFKSF